MNTPVRVWISEYARQRLESELAELRALLDHDTVYQTGNNDGDENSAAIQHARQNRIQQIHEVLIQAVVGDDPPDDGIAEPGMVLTVRYDDVGDTEKFLLGVRGTADGNLEIYSVRSPLGQAILGARPGEQRSYRGPDGTTIAVTLLAAVPYGLHERA